MATVADSLLTAAVEPSHESLILGFATALNSFVRTFAPAISGHVLEFHGFAFFGLLGVASCFIDISLCLFLPVPENQLRSSKDPEKKD